MGRRWSTRASRSSSSATSVRPAAARTLHRPPWLVRPCVASAVALVHRPTPPTPPPPCLCPCLPVAELLYDRSNTFEFTSLVCSALLPPRPAPFRPAPRLAHTFDWWPAQAYAHAARCASWRRLASSTARRATPSSSPPSRSSIAACDTSVVRGRRACAAAASSEGRVPARGCGSLAATACALRDVPCHIPPARAAGTSPTRASTYGCGARAA